MKAIQNMVNNIINQLENGIVPWKSPYRKNSLPYNYKTKKCYNGINIINLAFNNFQDQAYMTFLQVKELGGTVNKGAKASEVVYWFNVEDEDSETSHFQCKTYKVFNVEQTSLYEEKEIINEPIVEEVEKLIAKYDIDFSKRHSNGAYLLSEDKIISPLKSDYISIDEYYSTIFHELIHSTLPKLRPEFVKKTDLVLEELTAELGAAMLCQTYGVISNTENNEAYCSNWINNLKDLTTNKISGLLLKASKQAKQAYDLIIENKG